MGITLSQDAGLLINRGSVADPDFSFPLSSVARISFASPCCGPYFDGSTLTYRLDGSSLQTDAIRPAWLLGYLESDFLDNRLGQFTITNNVECIGCSLVTNVGPPDTPLFSKVFEAAAAVPVLGSAGVAALGSSRLRQLRRVGRAPSPNDAE